MGDIRFYRCLFRNNCYVYWLIRGSMFYLIIQHLCYYKYYTCIQKVVFAKNFIFSCTSTVMSRDSVKCSSSFVLLNRSGNAKFFLLSKLYVNLGISSELTEICTLYDLVYDL